MTAGGCQDTCCQLQLLQPLISLGTAVQLVESGPGMMHGPLMHGFTAPCASDRCMAPAWRHEPIVHMLTTKLGSASEKTMQKLHAPFCGCGALVYCGAL